MHFIKSKQQVLLKAFLLLLITVLTCKAASAQPTDQHYKLPERIIKKIINQAKETGWPCSAKAAITLYDLYSINNDKVLLLLGAPDYLCNSNSFLPVILDAKGTWASGEFMEGRPELIFKESETSVFMVTQWMIEGTYPTLFHSSDGIDWRMVALPEARAVDCCSEWLSKICLRDKRIHLTFEGDDPERTAYFSTLRHNVTNTTPGWRNDTNQTTAACSPASLAKLDITRTALKDSAEILFETRLGPRSLSFILPQWLALNR
ncbi:MAG: hypothetical protein KAS94_08535 [Desulfobulbaceae bacterium]|nr:hypothetical protein [Desulfobulbaceae bacterium]